MCAALSTVTPRYRYTVNVYKSTVFFYLTIRRRNNRSIKIRKILIKVRWSGFGQSYMMESDKYC